MNNLFIKIKCFLGFHDMHFSGEKTEKFNKFYECKHCGYFTGLPRMLNPPPSPPPRQVKIAVVCANEWVYEKYLKYKILGRNCRVYKVSSVHDTHGRNFDLMIVEYHFDHYFECDTDELIAATKNCLR